ncbi:hypothetical protein SDC9_182091 [bioreactor metagenome]|uniref:Uncharacterized protein n=1 Tax=bioreactor metagenome TaxID=1076179 RepID=A0A645H6E4_9ZZZZ
MSLHEDEVGAEAQTHGEGHDKFDGEGGVPVGKAPQGGLKEDAGQAARGQNEPHLAVGESPAQQQGGLVGADGGEHGPKAHLHEKILIIQPPVRIERLCHKRGTAFPSRILRAQPAGGMETAGVSSRRAPVREFPSWKKVNSGSRLVLPAVYRTMTRSGFSQST